MIPSAEVSYRRKLGTWIKNGIKLNLVVKKERTYF